MNTALIVAAGASTRAKLNTSKILYEINHKPLFMYSLEVFKAMGHDIVLVVSKEDQNAVKKFITEDIKLVIGGKTRSESVKNGLKVVETPYVFIHDAARPLISKQMVLTIEKALEYHDAVLLAEKVTSAIKHIENEHFTSMTRDSFLLAQTPQAFLTEKIRYAYLRNNDQHDDDISLYQLFYPEEKIHIVYNDEPNLKVTYPHDLVYVKSVLNERDENMRIGHSFDIHQLVEKRPLWLGGIEIPFDKGLLGHSDADVLLHAISEAILGALSLGDLGTHFPDSDPKYEGIDSKLIIKEVQLLMQSKGYKINNIDSTIYAELPKINPHIERIRESISRLLSIDIEQISVKASTYEKMDAIGEQRAMAAEAVVLLKKV
ncbi:MAG: 2-C-methyl-D-erythritol 2,4-cyclodiphosphate synthase [Acholeplasmataceae bacterium]|jgi:2-C-methyl-D-erythritol 4-phosphate cytidylyltransferase/2-C-methyl-D-erythritol 4-phosphate cytidylyltransferase/2-C-methyl-D-erythritol 2,4-cyclodiphosphate synthase|nr:2-C-methyl-D-erythritol 2,4-cyclodiphosphate synthase [Acholeplasmataceae bacterium]